MKVKHYLTGPLQVNTYLAYDEATKKGFIVDPGGYESRLTDDAEKEHIEVEYIILTHGHGDHIEEFRDSSRTFRLPLSWHIVKKKRC